MARPSRANVNDWVLTLGIASWKPVLSALLLPAVPLLVLVLIGARLLLPRRGLGWLFVIAGVVLLWLSTCVGAASLVTRGLLHPPAALSSSRVAELRQEVRAGQPIAIVILGGGMEPYAPEYGVSSLRDASLERLRYGIWLSRATGAPMAFSGGVGWSQPDAQPEAQVAARIAREEFGRPLKWQEDQSRDTRENAARTVAMLRASGITHILLVTHGWHMPRALRDFREAAGSDMRIEPAPMGLAERTERPLLAWLPSVRGYTDMHNALHEWLGRLAGA
jgi:uncharacterized SAM-binding protein YcdF (DUF218 family)